MLKRYQSFFGGLTRLTDALFIGGVWLLSYWARFELPIIEVTKGFPSFVTYASLTPLIMILWLSVFSSLGVYRPPKILRRTHEAFLVLRAHGVALLFFIALTYLFSEYKYSRAVMLFFGTGGALALVFSHLTLRNFMRGLRKSGRGVRRLVSIGSSPALSVVLERLRRYPELGIKVVSELTAADVQKLKTLIDRKEVDEVLVSLKQDESAVLNSILNLIGDEVISVQIIPDVYGFVTLGCSVEEFEGVPMIQLNDSPLNTWGRLLKRIVDFTLSLFALIILLPVFTVVGVLVKLTSRGPMFYFQERMGLDGNTFKMIKFRTMKVDAEKATGAVWAKQDDDRKTLVGAVLRKTSLDEIPQFWNVLMGEMSLVGPRPERPVFVTQFKNEIPHYMLRHKVKAGITGWAQVNGWRGNTSLSKRIEYDLYYIKHWSITFDLKILILTVFKGFIHRNAY